MSPDRLLPQALACGLLAAALALPAVAAPVTFWTGVSGSTQLYHTSAVPGQPTQTVQDSHIQTIYPQGANDPLRGTDLATQQHSELPAYGLSADAGAQAQMGVLKAFAQTRFNGTQGRDAHQGASAAAWSTFGDTIAVTGDGLAPGTAVTYTVDIDVHGLFEQVTQLTNVAYAGADLVVQAQDVDSLRAESFSWRPAPTGTPPTGLAGGSYRWSYQTTVGRSFVLSAMLNAVAQNYSFLNGSVTADLGHTVHIALDNADARLNTVGLSGHDFRLGGGAGPTPVPAPASAALVLLGLALAARQRAARCSQRTSSSR